MIFMHCQVRFSDFSKWKTSMDADGPAQRDAGIHLKYLWRGVDDPDTAFFVCEVTDKEKATRFMNPAEINVAAEKAGASDFQWCFVEPA